MVFHIYRSVIDRASESARAKNIYGRALRASAGGLCLFVLYAFCRPVRTLGQVSLPSPPAQLSAAATVALPTGSASRGRELFTGQARLQNGGPSCETCHSIAGLPFPNGGTLGPNLTGVYEKLGSEGMPIAVKTLYFPVMTSIYDPHPLTLEERADLLAFFKEAGPQLPARSNTRTVALIGFLGFCTLLVITRTVWRDRLRSVRRRMVETAKHQGGLPS